MKQNFLMILQDNPADFERHRWMFSVIMKSATWYLHCLGCTVAAGAAGGRGVWGRGTGRVRQAFFTLMNE